MSQVQQLYRLQQIDNEIRDKKQRLREVLQAQKANEALLAAQERHETATQGLADARQNQKELELELSQLNAKARRSEDRLYSGKVKNPKELSDLQQEIASLGRRRETLEDEILEVMLQVEQAQTQAQEAGQHLEEVESSWAQRVRSLQEEQNALAVRLNELLASREEYADRIEDQMLNVYETVRSKRGGIAVAGLKGELCQVCGVRTSNRKVRAAEVGELIYCGSCDRILAPI